MRFSLRNAVKFVVFVIFLLFANFVLFLHFAVHSDRPSEKVGDSQLEIKVNNGVEGEPVDSDLPNKLVKLEYKRKQRSAKSLPEEVYKNVRTNRDLRKEVKNDSELLKQRQHRKTELSDIFISVKTTKKFHDTRVKLLLNTWFMLARKETFFFTDADDEQLNKLTGGHVINTNCSAVHNRQALCCKMAIEYDTFMESNKRWFCHVDDDTYLNIPQLLKLLKEYNHTEDWYLGKPSLRHPIEIMDRKNPGQKLAFWFATGGAGFCISKALALKMMPYASGGRFMTTGEAIRLPDDCTVGYIIDYLLKKQLTVVNGFHSHLEALWVIKTNNLQSQISYSYSQYGEGKMNKVSITGFDNEQDPTRFKSIHCYLFPNFKECKNISAYKELIPH